MDRLARRPVLEAPPSAAATRRLRVLIADPSAVVRGLVARWLMESGFEVAATAGTGRAVVEALERVEPDMVLLDVDLPESDWLGTLARLLAKRPSLSVVMMAKPTARNAGLALRCVAAGAADCLRKPERIGEPAGSEAFRADITATVHALAAARHSLPKPGAAPVEPGPASSADACAMAPRAARPHAVAPRCLLIGASTGGPRAVAEVLSRLGPALRHVPVLLVQHMPPVFTTVFAEHLSAQAGTLAREAQDGEALVPGRVYVAPGGRHMRLASAAGAAVVRLDDGPPVSYCRPSVDVLFRDAAAVFGAAALAVVLTGMGSDGTEGARALVDAGATVLVQDERTSTVWGMPGSIARAGLAQDVLPLPAIGPALKALLTGRAV